MIKRRTDGNLKKLLPTIGVGMLLAATLATGCASDVANRYYAADRYPERPETEVEVLNAPPSRPHEIIADFQSRGESARDMRRKAAKIGADAVIVQFLGGQVRESSEWAGEGSNKTYTRITGTAIRYR